MSKTVIVDRMPRFKSSAYNVLNDAIIEGAKDVLIKAKTKAPYKKGGLRSQSDTRQTRPLSQRISFWIEYARYQEFGGDGKKIVRNYSTPGTSKGYLKSSGDEVAASLRRTFKKHGLRARV
jgi:hypothetical protein